MHWLSAISQQSPYLLKLSILLLCLSVVSGKRVAKRSENETGTIIPLYLYPATVDGRHNWQPLIDAHAKYPSVKVWAIVNVLNGPGSTADLDYESAIAMLKVAGILTLGYVRTDYTHRDVGEVRNDVDLWNSLYQPDGIFFDEMTNDDSRTHVRYYSIANKYAKDNGFIFTVGNPGSNVPAAYVNTVDTIMIYETDKGFPTKNQICGRHTNYPRDKWGIFPYSIPRLNKTEILAARDCVKYIYATNDGGKNPWDTLPPYLDELFSILAQ